MWVCWHCTLKPSQSLGLRLTCFPCKLLMPSPSGPNPSDFSWEFSGALKAQPRQCAVLYKQEANYRNSRKPGIIFARLSPGHPLPIWFRSQEQNRGEKWELLTLPGTRRCSALGKGRRKAVGLGVKAQGGGKPCSTVTFAGLKSGLCWGCVWAGASPSQISSLWGKELNNKVLFSLSLWSPF